MATPAASQLACAPYDEMTKLLEERYKEYPAGVGVEASGNLLELFATAEGETWSLLMVSSSGVSCVIAVGESWQTIQSVVPTDGV